MMSPKSPLSPAQQSVTLARLLSQRQWSLLETMLATTPRSSILIDDPSLPHAVTADIAVHFAARFQAPLRIISLLSRLYPDSHSSSDVTGRYPIHVAAKWAATPDVIAYLIKTNPSVAGIPDSTGKTPMHYVGEYYLQHFTNCMYSRDDSMLQVTRLLKNAAPMSVNLEDNEGMNAIEYALLSDANLKVIKTMQRACRDDWRERQRPCSDSSMDVVDEEGQEGEAPSLPQQQLGRRRHEDLVHDINSMAQKLQRTYTCDDGESKRDNERIHVHRLTSGANTRVARTA
eukprot:66839_1